MLPSLVNLATDERLARLTKDVLFYQLIRVPIIPELEAWWNTIDIFDQTIVKEWRPSLHRVRHLGAVTDAGEEEVWQMAFVPCVQRRVERMPLGSHELTDALVHILG